VEEDEVRRDRKKRKRKRAGSRRVREREHEIQSNGGINVTFHCSIRPPPTH